MRFSQPGHIPAFGRRQKTPSSIPPVWPCIAKQMGGGRLSLRCALFCVFLSIQSVPTSHALRRIKTAQLTGIREELVKQVYHILMAKYSLFCRAHREYQYWLIHPAMSSWGTSQASIKTTKFTGLRA